MSHAIVARLIAEATANSERIEVIITEYPEAMNFKVHVVDGILASGASHKVCKSLAVALSEAASIVHETLEGN